MSNLFKSKFLLGVMVVAVMLVGFAVVNTNTAAAATCTITKTLKVGSKGAEVKCLQAALNVSPATGTFGPKTKAAVVAWQKTMKLAADGVFGAKSRAAWTGGVVITPTTGGTLPAGCNAGDKFSSTSGAPCLPGTTAQTGPLAVSVATDNPASGYIVGNQATADLAHFTFSGNGTVNQVTLQRTGVSDQNTLNNVYLYDGTTRLTDGYSFNNSGQLVMNNLGIVVNGSKTLSVKADVASVTNASTLGITLVSWDIDSLGSTPATVVNLSGNTMTYGQGNLASVYLATQASVAVPAASVNAGTSAYTVWSAPVQVNVRAVSLKGANFRMVGSAPIDALQNIKLYVDGVDSGVVATAGSITGTNYAMFNFASPISLSTGSHTVDVRADVVKGANYDVTLSIQQAADLVIFDPQVGVNIAAAVNATTSFAANTAGKISINAGSASVVVDPAFQSLTNVTGGATNTVIGRFKIHGYGEDVKVTTLNVTPILTGTTPAAAGLNNLTVYFNGSQVGSSFNWTSGTKAFSLGSQMVLPAGTDSFVEIRADLQTSGSVNYTAGTVSATLSAGASNAQGQTSKTTVSFPTADVLGNSLTVQTGVLAVSRIGSNTTSNPNTANVKVGSFVLQNQSSSEPVRVTSLTVGLTDGTNALSSSSTPALTNFSNLKTSETSGSGSTPVQPAATNTFSVNFTLAPGATKTVDVFADVGAAVSANVAVKMTVTSLGSNSNVSITQNGNGTAVFGFTTNLIAGALTIPPTLVSSASTTGQFVPAATSGATNATKAEFNLAATNGSAVVSEMKFVVRGPATNTALTAVVNPVTSVSIGSVSAPVVSAVTNSTTTSTVGTGTTIAVASGTGIAAGSVILDTRTSEQMLVTDASTLNLTVIRGYNSTTTTPTANADTINVYNSVAYLTGLNLAVPNGGSGLNVDAMVSYAPVGTNGVASMTLNTVSLSYLKYTAGGTTSTACVSSLTCTLATLVEVAAPQMAMVGSKPTLAVGGSTDTLVNGLVKVAELTVSADQKGDIKLVTLPVKISTTGAVTWNGSANAVIVKDTSGTLITTTNAAAVQATGDTCTTTTITAVTGTCTSLLTFGTGYTIPAGTSKTFRIYVTAASVAGAVNTMSLSTTYGAANNTTTSLGLTWLDTAGANTTAITSAQNATYFYNYPTDTSVIHN